MDQSAEILELLRKYESPNVTYLDPDGTWPIVWERARGCHVWDISGKKYLDLTAAFGVAVTGHANDAVVSAGHGQMDKLLHAMGDVHPHALKAQLCRELSRWTFERWTSHLPNPVHGRTTLCNSGFEAVETALKTAVMATGRPRILAFEGGYHGLGYGALNATHRPMFRDPFLRQIGQFGDFVPFPQTPDQAQDSLKIIRKHLESGQIGAIILEPAQARGGLRFPPEGFLFQLRQITLEFQSLLILDEIYTGFGRTGTWFACESENVIPDLICLGKALTGGFPMAACTGTSASMQAAWPASRGEAIHTSTFLGHPVGCAMALAQLRELEDMDGAGEARKKGGILAAALESAFGGRPGMVIRGRGLMAGLEVMDGDGCPDGGRVIGVVKRALEMGYIFLPCGESGQVMSWTPGYVIGGDELEESVAVVADLLGGAEG